MGILKDINIVNCNNCVNISLTEKEQTDKKEDHVCNVYKVRCFHGDNHLHDGNLLAGAYITPCFGCIKDAFKNFKGRGVS